MSKKQIKASHISLKPRKIKIRVVGLGGGGSSIVCEMAQNLKGVSFVVADTDARVFQKVKSYEVEPRRIAPASPKVFLFGEKLLHGMGTGMMPELAEKAALEEKDKIAKLFDGQDLIVFIGCLGGGVASGAGPVFAEIARKPTVIARSDPKERRSNPVDGARTTGLPRSPAGSLAMTGKPVTIGIFTLPFSFEGEKKTKIARRHLDRLQQNLSATVVAPNEKIFQLIDKKTPLKKALSTLNKLFADWLQGLIVIIGRPGLINIDFADLKTVLKDRGNSLFFSQAEAQGSNRMEEVIKRIFQNPLVPAPSVKPKRILFNIAGGKDLTLKEVEQISQSIAKLNPRGKIIFGVSDMPQNKARIKVSLLAVSRNKKPLAASPKKPLTTTSKKPAATLDEKKAKKRKNRRTALEVKKDKDAQEEKEWAQEPDWQIPAFLRKKHR